MDRDDIKVLIALIVCLATIVLGARYLCRAIRNAQAEYLRSQGWSITADDLWAGVKPTLAKDGTKAIERSDK